MISVAALRALASPLKQAMVARSDRHRLQQLRQSGAVGEKLYSAISGISESGAQEEELIRRIEEQRAWLLQRSDPLVDGSLGEAGLFDQGKSVADAAQASRKPAGALMLYTLVRTFRPQSILELGTNVGISSAYLAAGQQKNGSGLMVTMDASPYRQKAAKQIHSRIGLPNISYVPGLFIETLGPQLERMPQIDMAFIDGDHLYQPTLDYFDQIHRHAAEECVFVFDDIDWSDGMRQAWAELREDARFNVVADLGTIGIAISASGRGSLEHVTPRLRSILK